MNNKILLRKQAKEIRKTLDISGISEKIVSNIKSLDVYKSAENVMIFYPLEMEINLLPLISPDKNFYLPRVNGEYLDVCPYKSGDDLILSMLKIPEPKTDPVELSQIDLIFTPALMIDKNFCRLGYGGGFYDRLLNDFNGVKAGVIPSELYTDTLPVFEYDVPLNFVITETAVYSTLSV